LEASLSLIRIEVGVLMKLKNPRPLTAVDVFSSRAAVRSALISFAVAIYVCICMVTAIDAFAQQTTSTSVSSDKNPSRAFESVTLTAIVSPVRVSTDFQFALSVGSPAGSSRFIRVALNGAQFASTVTSSQLTVPGNAGGLASVSVLLGGQPGASYVVFQIAPAGAGLKTTDIVKFAPPLVDLVAVQPGTSPSPTTVSFSVHETLTSGCCVTPPNSALIYQAPLANILDFVAAPSPSGTVVFKADGVVLPGCSAAALNAGVATCTTSFPNVGLQTVTAEYGGGGTFASSTGTLLGGQQVLAGGTASSSLRSSRNPSTLGDRLSITLAIVGENLAGKVSFCEPNAPLANRNICSAVPVVANTAGAFAVCEVPSVNRSLGSHVYSATFTPDSASTSISASMEQVIYEGATALLLSSAAGQSVVGNFAAGKFSFLPVTDPGQDFQPLAFADLDGNLVPDLIFQNLKQGDSGDVRVWKDGNAESGRSLRSVKFTWRLEAVGDLDGDGFGDLVWRFTGQTPNANDTGVSYVWFTDGDRGVTVRKRGGAPLSWQLIGAVDINRDRAADLIYLSPERQLRVLVATSGRTCANFGAGTIPVGYSALRVGDFTGSRLGEVLIRNATTGESQIISLDGTALTVPVSTANPDDANASCTPTPQVVPSATRTLLTTNPAWQYFASLDLNGDGIQDIIWIKPDRSLAVWLMQAGSAQPFVIDNAGTAPLGFAPVGR